MVCKYTKMIPNFFSNTGVDKKKARIEARLARKEEEKSKKKEGRDQRKAQRMARKELNGKV